jgi:hypothetical protein
VNGIEHSVWNFSSLFTFKFLNLNLNSSFLQYQCHQPWCRCRFYLLVIAHNCGWRHLLIKLDVSRKFTVDNFAALKEIFFLFYVWNKENIFSTQQLKMPTSFNVKDLIYFYFKSWRNFLEGCFVFWSWKGAKKRCSHMGTVNKNCFVPFSPGKFIHIPKLTPNVSVGEIHTRQERKKIIQIIRVVNNLFPCSTRSLLTLWFFSVGVKF